MIDETTLARARALLDDPDVSRLLRDLHAPGAETRLVGGALRNALLGFDAKDIDFATTLTPEAVCVLGRAAGWHAVPTGIEHGTVTLVRAGRAFEITTLREDIATDGRRAVVRFGRDFRLDAARRDFTMNALFMGGDGVLHDYFDGAADIAARRVRFIGDAGQRLREDYLRGLRFLRFSAAYGGGRLDPEGFGAVKAHRAGFARLSRERVRQEVMRLLVADHAVGVLAQAEAAGLMSEVLGCPVDVARLAARLALADQTGEGEVCAIARLNAFAGADEARAVHLRDALRLSNPEAHFLRRVIEAQHLFRAGGALRFFELGDRFGDVGPEALRLAALDTGDITLLDRLPEVEHPPVFDPGGKDVLALGCKPGPAVGLVLQAAKARWAALGFPADPAEQRRLLAETVSRHRET